MLDAIFLPFKLVKAKPAKSKKNSQTKPSCLNTSLELDSL